MTALILAITLGAVPDLSPNSMYEMLKDAQVANMAHLRSGRMEARVSLTMGDRPPTLLATTFYWRGDAGFWIYRWSDPSKLYSASFDYATPLEEAPTDYKLIVKNELMNFDSRSNKLRINEFAFKRKTFAGFELFDLFPANNWNRCCVPTHSGGGTWAELLGPNSPALRPGATVTIESIGEGLFKQTRRDPGGGTSEIICSMHFAGMPISARYLADGKSHVVQSAEYEWKKQPNGVVVLKKCKGMNEQPNGSGTVRSQYSLTIREIDVDNAIPESRFTFRELRNLLPRDAEVLDRIRDQRYPLFKDSHAAVITKDRLKPLGVELRSRGFLKER